MPQYIKSSTGRLYSTLYDKLTLRGYIIKTRTPELGLSLSLSLSLSPFLPLHTGLGKFSNYASASNAFNRPNTREQV